MTTLLQILRTSGAQFLGALEEQHNRVFAILSNHTSVQVSNGVLFSNLFSSFSRLTETNSYLVPLHNKGQAFNDTVEHFGHTI
jgi:hypothetical protein